MEERRLVLLGKTGSGKSSTANTILGEKKFTVGWGSVSTTSKCSSSDTIINGKKIVMIDTPGYFDTTLSENILNHEIEKCITTSSPGPHAFLILLKVEVYSLQEMEGVKMIIDKFGEDALKYAVIVFTRGDQLPDEETIEQFVEVNVELMKLVEKCQGRYHVIDNKYWNQDHEYRSNRVQVEKLLNTIEEMIRQNGNQHYSNDMFFAVEHTIRAEESIIRNTNDRNYTERDIRQVAQEKVAWIIKAAGIATGALLGALLGIPVVTGAGLILAGRNLQFLFKIVSRIWRVTAVSLMDVNGGRQLIVNLADSTGETAAVVVETGAEAAKAVVEAAGAASTEERGSGKGIWASAIKAGTALETAAAVEASSAASAVAEGIKTAWESAVVVKAAGRSGSVLVVNAGQKAGAVTGGVAAETRGAIEAGSGASFGKAALVGGMTVIAVGTILGGLEGARASTTARTPREAAHMASNAVLDMCKITFFKLTKSSNE